MCKRIIAFLAILVMLCAMTSFTPAKAAIQRYGHPRFDDVYMQIITNPNAQVAAFQACQIEMLPDILRWDIITKLEAEGNTVIRSPAFHLCAMIINCRDYVPDDYGQPQAGRPLEPLNFTAFRLALAWAGLSRAEKEQAIIALYGGPAASACDSIVPPSLGVWNDPTVSPPGGSNETAYQKLITEGGFYVSGGHLYQPNGVQVRTPIEVLSPSESPSSVAFVQKYVDKWNFFFMDYLGTDVQFVNIPVSTYILLQRVYWYRNFDVCGFLCWSLGRFPDYLYDWFHSSQDYPGGGNAAGIKDPLLDYYLEIIKFGLVYEEKLDACYTAQHMIVEQLIPCIPILTKNHFTAFKNYDYYTGEDRYLTNMVNMRGYGADNRWTWGLMHWNTAPTGGTLKYCLTGNIENLHPGWAMLDSEWDVLNRITDTLIAATPDLGDLPWIACNWAAEPFNDPGSGIINGEKVTFQIRSDVTWHDGYPVTIEDIQFALGDGPNKGFIRNFPQYRPIYEKLMYSYKVDPCTIEIYISATSQWILYDLAEVALLFPKHIYGPGGWLETHGYDPVSAAVWEIPYGVGGCPTALVGCGPYMFDYWDPTTNIVHIIKNPNYWVDGPIKQNFIAPQRVENCTIFGYYLEFVNTGSKDEVTGELVPMIIDWIDVTANGEIIDTIIGPFVIDPFGVLVLGPYEYHFPEPGFHHLDCHTYAYGELYDSYIHPIWVTIIGDMNYDFTINFLDAIILGRAFGSKPGDPNWDDRADIRKDFFVNYLDAIRLGAVFGWPDIGPPPPTPPTFEQRRDELLLHAREINDSLIQEALDILLNQAGTVHDGGDLGQGTTGQTTPLPGGRSYVVIDTEDDNRPGERDGHFWQPKDVDNDGDGDDADVINTFIHEARHVWQNYLCSLILNEAQVDMDLNGDGDKNDNNISNDFDGDRLPSWVPSNKGFDDRPLGQDVKDDDVKTPVPWDDPGGARERRDNDAYDFQERVPKNPWW